MEDLRKSLGQDQAMLDLLADQHEMVIAFCIALVRNRALAEDIAQDVFLAAQQQMDAGAVVNALGPWLRGIARHVAAQALRKLQSERARLVTLDAYMTTCETIFAAADGGGDVRPWHERMKALAQCRLRLPRHQQRAIVLRYDQTQSTAEMTSATGWSDRTVHQLLCAARRSLHQCIMRTLAGEDGDHV